MLLDTTTSSFIISYCFTSVFISADITFKNSLEHFFFKFGFTPCKAEQPLQGMELQEKETQKD